LKKETIQKINDAADLKTVIESVIVLKKKGAAYIGNCPKCDGVGNLNVSVPKQIYKCFACDFSGKYPMQFLQGIGKSFQESAEYIAKLYNIDITENNKPVKKASAPKKKTMQDLAELKTEPKQKLQQDTFKDKQLRSSGLQDEDTTIEVIVDANTKQIISRYQAATIDAGWNIITGDDMILHYVDLFYKGAEYYKTNSTGEILNSKPKPFFRVRWQSPEVHTDRDGKPIKYQSPYKSGIHLWLPTRLIKMFTNRVQFETLYVTEGEKKADKATLHGMPAVGIMGINSLVQNKSLPKEFELLIRTCGIKNVVFVLDNDWQNLPGNIEKGIDTRARQFLAAVRNFKDYFYSLQSSDVVVDTFLAHIAEGEQKGIDDILVFSSLLAPEDLKKEFSQGLMHPEFKGKLVCTYKITGYSELLLKKLFHLQDAHSFAMAHKQELQKLPEFLVNKFKYKFNDKGEVELAEPLLPDQQFWEAIEKRDKNGQLIDTQIRWIYDHAFNFLHSRDFHLVPIDSEIKKIVQLEGKVMVEKTAEDVRDFVREFIKALNEPKVLQMFYSGEDRYFSSTKLRNIYKLYPAMQKSEKGLQYLYFQNNYWEITEQGIKEFPIKNLNKNIWSNKIIDFDAKASTEPLLTINKITEEYANRPELKQYIGNYEINISDTGSNCHFLMFLVNASNFFWDDRTKVDTGTEDFRSNYQAKHLLNKLTIFGYMLHTFRDENVLKAVIAMDGKESEVGKSNGRSGKSIVGFAFEHVVPTAYIDGKKPELTKDKWIFDEVDERTDVVFLDDVRRNIDFEFFLTCIGGKMQIEARNQRKRTLKKEDTPKFYFSTNHAINGEDDSFTDRQAIMIFSDYYNPKHRPIHDFKKMFFTEWEFDQWNLFYNLCATCLQLYFQLGIYEAPLENMVQRKLRQQFGENFLDWAELYFSNEINFDVEIPRLEITNNFYEMCQGEKKYTTPRLFKQKLKAYCQYKNWVFNPGFQQKDKHGNIESLSGGDQKTNGMELFKITRKQEVEKEFINPSMPA
jgi:DNA primase